MTAALRVLRTAYGSWRNTNASMACSLALTDIAPQVRIMAASSASIACNASGSCTSMVRAQMA